MLSFSQITNKILVLPNNTLYKCLVFILCTDLVPCPDKEPFWQVMTYLNAQNSKDYEERAADEDDVSDGL